MMTLGYDMSIGVNIGDIGISDGLSNAGPSGIPGLAIGTPQYSTTGSEGGMFTVTVHSGGLVGLAGAALVMSQLVLCPMNTLTK